MNRNVLRIAACLLILFYTFGTQAEDAVETILFGSCIQQDRPMPILRKMADLSADVVIFLGDNIYADTSEMQVMREKYQVLARNPDFQSLQQSVPLLATWDDHDFGINDGGANYAQRDLAQREFMDFWKVPEDSDKRKRAGVYDSVVLGPVGQRVQVILLDTRYFRSPLKTAPERRVGGPYVPDYDPTKTMLGTEQWNWLKEQLLVPAEIRILASSIQFAASDAGQETWANLPLERAKFIQRLAETKAEGLFIISGDRHWSEFSLLKEGVPYPLYDLTSSSFNQIHPRGTPTENKYRFKDTTYHRENFGVIRIDWSNPRVPVKVEIRDVTGQIQLEHVMHRDELQALEK